MVFTIVPKHVDSYNFDGNISPEVFFSTCHQLTSFDGEDYVTTSHGLNCTGTYCTKGHNEGEELVTTDLSTSMSTSTDLVMDVSDLQGLVCQSSADCLYHSSGMECERGKCICPYFKAFNVSTCRCESADFCLEDDPSPCYSHNNKRCVDRFCSCFDHPNFRDVLLDPEYLFCILPGRPSIQPSTGGVGTAVAILCVLGGGAVLVILLLVTFLLYRNFALCEKGDYKCDTVDAVQETEVHNASWDYPSLDYIPKDEEIVFTLAQAKDMVGASNASTIHVTDEVAMCPIDQEIMRKGIMYNHDNLAYVEDENHNT